MPLSLPRGPQLHSLKKTVKAVYSGQWNLSFPTPLIKGHFRSGDAKFFSRKNAYIIYVSNASIEGTLLFTLAGTPFLGPILTLA